MVADLALQDFTSPEVTVIRYADDEAIMAVGSDVDKLLIDIQRVVTRLVEINQSLGLNYSASKSQALVFTAKQKPNFDIDRVPKIKVQGTEIEYSQSVKYLGVHLQTNLGWSKNLEETLVGITRKLFAARRVNSQTSGLPLKATRWIYDGIIVPKATYCSVVWSSGLTRANERVLSKINRLGINLAIFPKRSTPTEALEVILNRPPLRLVANRLAINTWARLRDSLGHTWPGVTCQPRRRPFGHRMAMENELNELLPKEVTLEPRNVERWTANVAIQTTPSLTVRSNDYIVTTRPGQDGLPTVMVRNETLFRVYLSNVKGTERITTLRAILDCLETHPEDGKEPRFLLEQQDYLTGCLKDYQTEHRIKLKCWDPGKRAGHQNSMYVWGKDSHQPVIEMVMR